METVIEQYIAKFDGIINERLNLIYNTIKQIIPQASERMSWSMPTFFLKGNLVHFATFKNHIGFYPAPSAIEAFSEELREYKTSKGAVQFPHSKPIPIELISKIVKFRVNESQKGESHE